MKSKKTIIGLCIVLLIVVIIVARLVSNKNKRDAEIRAVSEFSVTVPVITDTVKHLDSNNVIVSNGNFEAAREITVASETQGKVTAVKGDAGSKVATGQTLAETDHRIYISQLNSSKFNMVALYESYLYPFVVLFSIPLAVIGAILALALAGQNLSIFSMYKLFFR